MSVAIVVITDGRSYLNSCLESLEANLRGPVTQKILISDAGIPGHQYGDELPRLVEPKEWLSFYHVERQGIAASVNDGWRFASNYRAVPNDYVWLQEDDFTFNKPIDLEPMIAVLEAQPHLAQIVLRRQPWSPEEIEKGSVGGLAPGDDYAVKHDDEGHTWTEQANCFSCNPCLIPRRVFERRFTDEIAFGQELVAEGMCFAFWGGPEDAPLVTHIGYQRSGHWRL